ncbi:MAG TPA: MotA/TolQ/ExbB proton channel family protein [Nitrososphaera sp.]|nr:MotA/TolQ/ExbB proton channel family protein [Nitrososphaera sp.]
MLRHLLLLRLSLTTIAGASVAVWAHANGLVVPIFETDVSYLSYAIAALFLVGLASTFQRAAMVGAAIDEYKEYGVTTLLERRARKLSEKYIHISDIAGWLQLLGMLGTVIGLAIALDGKAIDDAVAIQQGVKTAIGTTIIGGFLSLWTSINFRMLDTATVGLLQDVQQ